MTTELLEQKRRRYEDGAPGIQETAHKLTEVGRLLETCPRRVAVSTDRESLEFWQNDGESDYLSRGELDRLLDLVSRTHFLGFEIRCLEEELDDADPTSE